MNPILPYVTFFFLNSFVCCCCCCEALQFIKIVFWSECIVTDYAIIFDIFRMYFITSIHLILGCFLSYQSILFWGVHCGSCIKINLFIVFPCMSRVVLHCLCFESPHLLYFWVLIVFLRHLISLLEILCWFFLSRLSIQSVQQRSSHFQITGPSVRWHSPVVRSSSEMTSCICAP